MRVEAASAMATAAGGVHGATIGRRGLSAARGSGAPERLAFALLAIVLYAAFAHGAVSSPAEPRLQVGVAAVAAIAAAVWLWRGTLRLAAPRLAWLGVALLGAFTVWAGVSLAWSVYPDGTWLEVNRYVTYAVVLVLAIMVGASTRRSTELVQCGLLAVAALVTLYALGQKLVPWLHVPGLFDLNQTGAVPRLQQPLGYWNALGLLLSMAVPLGLAIVLDRSRSSRLRVAALVLLQLMFLTIGLTYSRGGLVSLGLGVIAAIALSGARLRALAWLGAAVAGSVVPLVVALVSHTLTTPGVSLEDRSRTGAELLVIVIAFAAGLILAGRRLLALERSVRITPARSRSIGRGLVAAVGLALVVGVLAVSFSARGLSGSVSHAWNSFTATRGLSNTDPNRLLSADSGNRWVWWKEAVGAFSSEPIRGWGVGSFPVVHLLYRRNTLSVKQPHSVPLQYLAETGLIGTTLAIGAFLALLVAGARAVRPRADTRRRLAAAALFGAALAYAVHACYDWDSDIPGVTLPALLMLGVLVGSARPRPGEEAGELRFGHLPGAAAPRLVLAPGPGLRLVAVVLSTLTLSSFAISAALPSLAQTKASGAVILATAGTGAALRSADREAALSAGLDPLSDAGLRVESTIAQRRGDFAHARADLIAALRRDPSDGQAWLTLAYDEILFGGPGAGLQAVQRALQADPEGYHDIVHTGALAQSALTRLARPSDSATAAQTPAAATATSTTTPTATTSTGSPVP